MIYLFWDVVFLVLVKCILLEGIKSNSISSNLRECSWATAGVCCKEVIIIDKLPSCHPYVCHFFPQMFLSNTNLFRLKFLHQTILLLIIMFCLSFWLVLPPSPFLFIYLYHMITDTSHDLFRSYGIILWYPTYIKEITTQKDTHDLQKFCNKKTSFSPKDSMKLYCDCTSTLFQDTIFSLPELKDWRINNVQFRNVTFLNVTFDSVLFNGTEFTECKFQNCTFTKLLFNATVFYDVQFQSVNILATSLRLFSNISEGAVTLENVTINSKWFESHNTNISMLWTILESEVNLTCSDDHYNNVICTSNDFRVYRDSFFSCCLSTSWKHCICHCCVFLAQKLLVR